jgi:hypothetical protein
MPVKREANTVTTNRLLDIGREIAARVDRLDKIGVKAVDHVDSINHLLAEAEKLCETAEVFEAFKQNHCPNLGRSRTYEILAIKEGRKSLDGIRALTRARVAKHRAAKSRKPVTDKPSVTLAGDSVDPSKLGSAAQSQITDAVEAEAAARKVLYAESEQTLVPAEQTTVEERRRAAARSHPRNASISLKCFLNACYSFIPDLNGIELEKAAEVFKQCAKEAKKRIEKRKTDPAPPPAQAVAPKECAA